MKPLYNSVYVTYTATFGKCDGSEEVEWGDVDLTGTDAEEYTKACMLGIPVDEMDSLAEVRHMICSTILEQEIENYHEMYDEDDEDYEEEPEFDISVDYNLIDPDYDDLVKYIECCFRDGDIELAEQIYAVNEPLVAYDLHRDMFLAAIRAGYAEYIKNHYTEYDLNPSPDYASPYVYEAIDSNQPEMRTLLVSLGAKDSTDE